MLRRKLSTLFLCASLLLCNLPFSSSAFASPSDVDTANIQDITLTETDKSSIRESIDEVLSFRYEVLKTGEAKDYRYVIKEPKLLELINKKSKLDVDWFKKFDGRTKEYISDVNILDLNKTADNTYVVNVLYGVEYQLEGANFTSKSKNEKYRFEVKYEDGKWYITKMLDLNEDNGIDTNQQISQASSSAIKDNSTEFSNYNDIIDSEIKTIDDKYQNMDENYKNYVQSDYENSNSKISLQSYSGYNAASAVAYAQRYGANPNPKYVYSKDSHGNDADCTNFVSQCALAGGIPASRYWYAYSAAWVNVEKFYTYMASNGYASTIEGARGKGTKGARAGDIVQFRRGGEWVHSVILSGTVNGGQWVYCGHSNDCVDSPLYERYDSGGYSSLRTLKFWH
ncbi:amidase domain-containing protein [Clostridium kluyveri]|uniref:Putative amidase domain-containing protein n=1 Tax=Clostridium kluyveri TaxID=1534 RepID=A0A1L5F3T8_CLOKL|nr:amidase domain-containing protein [Clostridium kluyveri]APM37675.1 hypothetical protein BS101_02360 [Clostridium kluyveri]